MRLRLIILLAALLTLGGCGLGSSPEERATEDAKAKAHRVGNALYDRGRVWSAQDVGHRAADLKDVEVMKVSGRSTGERRGVRVVIRVEGSAPDGEWMSSTTITVRRCFELAFDRESEWDDSPQRVGCPTTAPLAFGPWPKTPELPSEERLRKALPRVPAGGTVNEAKVRAAVATLDLDPAIRSEFLTLGNVVGVSLIVKPYLDQALECRLARVAPGKTEVFRPASRIQRMPGEGGCGAGNAISPMRAPH